MRRASATTIRSGFTTSRALGDLAVGEDVADAVEARVEVAHRVEDLLARERHADHAGQQRPDGLGHVALGREDPLHVPAEDVGQGEQAQRLGRRGAVDDHEVVLARVDERLDVGEGEDLVEARG